MIDFIKYLIANIADNKDAIQIEESIDPSGIYQIDIYVAEDDMGKVIGKNGKIISAIRDLGRVKAIKENKRVNITLKDPNQTDSVSQ